MGKLSSLIWGLGMGAGLMYFMDPQLGNRRKALVRDRVASLKHQGDDAVEVAMRDARNRIRGVLSEGIGMVSEGGAPSYVIEERVRSRLGFLTRHPGAVQVSIQNKEITLTGDVLAEEVDHLVKGVSKIRGVDNVRNNLRVHQDAGNIPQLQGQGWMPGEDRGAMMWSPSTRLLAVGGSLYLMLYGMARGGLIGFFARIGGLALGTRALTNLDMGRLTGMTQESDAIRIRKGLTINAPVDQVYSLWSNFENFPKFMANIESIKNLGNGRSHWVVKGPAGTKVEFDAHTTENRPNEMIAWETTKDSMVKHHGQVVFTETANNKTQLSVNMAYTPPAGVAGHAVASLFGRDPKSEMDQDLARMKSLLEEGKTRAEGKQVTRDRVMPVTGQDDEPGKTQTGPSGKSGQAGGQQSGKQNREGGGSSGSENPMTPPGL
jgi:uncharacterized membrane protein